MAATMLTPTHRSGGSAPTHAAAAPDRGAGHTIRTVTGPPIMTGTDTVVALRRGRVIPAGEILGGGAVDGRRLVSATDAHGGCWWIPAEAVWCDGESAAHPERPRPVGLATAGDVTSATLQGLSDRLGWEAVLRLERGHDLPVLALPGDVDPTQFVLLDGRLGHDVPTVVILGADVTRWGAAGTWERALRRALYGGQGLPAEAGELDLMAAGLAELGLHPVVVDLGTPTLRRLGISRCSVQLLATG
jgi:hypothetical protein